MGTIAVKEEETRHIFDLCEDLKRRNHRLYFMDVLDDYVRQRAWSGEAADQFKMKIREIEDGLIDDRTKLTHLIDEFEEYTKKVIAIDKDGL